MSSAKPSKILHLDIFSPSPYTFDVMQNVAEPPAITSENIPKTAGMTTKVVKGSLWTLAGQIAPLAVSLVATPFTIRLLGADGYGVLILVGLIPTYLGFADLGMGIASTKFGSEAYAAGDAEKEARTVRTAAVLSLALSVPFAILIFALSGWLATLFNVPEHLHAEASLALKVAAFTFVLNFLNSIFNTPQLDRLRMDLNTFVTSGFRILGIAATPFVIYLGGGILGAVLVLCTGTFLTLVGHIYTSGRLLPRLYGLTFDRALFRPMAKFGGALAFVAVAGILLVHSEKLFLARLTSVEALAFYSVAFTFANMVTQFFVSLIQSLLPAFSQLSHPERRVQFNQLFERIIRLNALIMFPALGLLCILAKPFFSIWAGPDFGRESTVPFYLLCFGLMFNLVANIPYCAITALGRTDILAKAYWIQLIPYLFIVYFLVANFGIYGAAGAWSIRMILDAMMLAVIAKRVLRVSFGTKAQIRKLLLSGVILSIILTIAVVSHGDPIRVTLAGSIGILLFVVLAWRHLLEQAEKTWLLSQLAPLGSGIFRTRH
ncbi:MAG: flippase [Acidobacteria bacterium]|nr:flippase [Acidobacteriota bacterium]